MIYRTLKKVSNVCQLLDKSKYHKTLTINGVTFTNNGDGTITINGTATNEIYYTIFSFGDSLSSSHKYLVTGENSGLYLFVENRDKDNKILAQLVYNEIRSLPANTKRSTYVCYIKTGAVCDNLVLKPQLFDLTEMYGAGNEPTTVEEFKSKFPNDLYDYSPRCFITSYKNMMICKTKNLFPTSTAVGTLSGFDTATPRQFEEGKWYIGITRNNYYVPHNITEYELTENYVYSYSISAGYGLGRAFKCEPNQTYTISCKWIKTGDTQYIGTGFYDENGNYLTNITSGALPKRFTIATPANCKWFTVVFSGQGYVYNIQIEKGPTATDFIPNGYIQSYKKSLVCKTKNLFDINKAKVNMQNDGSFVPTVGHTDHFYSMNVKAGETYTVSYYTTSFGSIGSGLNLSIQTGDFYRDGVQLFLKINPKEQYAYQKGTFTIPDGANKITFSSIMSSCYYNFMIELGNTATDYVPYGHL